MTLSVSTAAAALGIDGVRRGSATREQQLDKMKWICVGAEVSDVTEIIDSSVKLEFY